MRLRCTSLRSLHKAWNLCPILKRQYEWGSKRQTSSFPRKAQYLLVSLPSKGFSSVGACALPCVGLPCRSICTKYRSILSLTRLLRDPMHRCTCVCFTVNSGDIVPALRRLRQENYYELNSSLGCAWSRRPARATLKDLVLTTTTTK